MIDFLSIVLLIFGVLQIILFFKMWIMTNDVKKIAKKLQCEKDSTWNVRRALLSGDKELAKKELIDCIVIDLEKFGDGGYGFNCINDIIAKYEPAFKDLNMDIPESIRNLKSYSDIRDIIKFGTK
ncbi:MAG: hypothetical protein ACK5LF_09915 [Bacteroides xylanisolvens]